MNPCCNRFFLQRARPRHAAVGAASNRHTVGAVSGGTHARLWAEALLGRRTVGPQGCPNVTPNPPNLGAPPALLPDDPFRDEPSLTLVCQPGVGREFEVQDAKGRSLGAAAPTLRGWTGVLDYDLKDGSDRLLLSFRLGPFERSGWVRRRSHVLTDAAAATVGTLESRRAGWSGRRYTLRREEREYLVVPTISRFRENPLLRDGGVVGSVRSGGTWQSTYTVRFSGSCSRLHAVGLLVFIGLRTGHTNTVGD